MGIEFVSPVGRLVQGGVTLEVQKDDNGQVKVGSDGQPIRQCFMAVAFRKDDPQFNQLYVLMVGAARAAYPTIFDANGNCTHPGFAMKLQDGDGVDKTGQSVKDKPGFAGHWIVKMATQYLPKCYHEGKFDPAQQIQNPAEVIKRGYYIRVAGQIRDNGVSLQDRTKKPGIFISPNLVSLVAYGEEIVGGPDATKVFGGVAVGALPPGATSMPTVGAAAPGALPGAPTPGPMPAMPAAPAAVAAAAVAPVPVVAAAPAPAAIPAPPAAVPAPLPAGPTYAMTAAAQGATREQLIAAGWTDAALLQHGMMVVQG